MEKTLAGRSNGTPNPVEGSEGRVILLDEHSPRRQVWIFSDFIQPQRRSHGNVISRGNRYPLLMRLRVKWVFQHQCE